MKNHFCRWKKMRGKWAAGLLLLLWLVGGISVGLFVEKSEPDSLKESALAAAQWRLTEDYLSRVDRLRQGAGEIPCRYEGERTAEREAILWVLIRGGREDFNEEVSFSEEEQQQMCEIYRKMTPLTIQCQITGGKTTAVIRVLPKGALQLAQEEGWPQEQTARLEKALQQEDFWQQWERKAAGSHPLVQAAASQLGQTGGEPYWSWYGFSQRVEWCACFVSWCGEQSGLLQQGCLPKFSSCHEGMQWFLQQNRWREGGTTPQPGDLIFFDWDQDGTPNHVGIVQGVKNGQVHTIEGNSEDACRKRTYEKDDERILGYGMTKREK